MDCAYHPGKEAVAQCSKCGKPLCDECSKSPDAMCIDCLIPTNVYGEATSKIQLMNWEGWTKSFIASRKTFKESRKLTSSAGIAMNLLVGLVNAGIIAFLLAIVVKQPGESADLVTGTFVYITQFMVFLFIWLVIALVSYSFAMLAGGTGRLDVHLYLLSLLVPISPFILLLLEMLFGFIISLDILVVMVSTILVAIYVVYIMINAMEEAHGFGFLQAAGSGVLSVVVTGGAVGLLIFVLRIKV
jgi:hypothetical protein